jgi:hypothetical protein
MAKNPAKPFHLTRKIRRPVERELWGRAAARCEFSDCNRLLYKSPVTQEPVNLAEMAHIYSFSKGGPRGWGLLMPRELNDVQNLMLVCHDCHKKIDQDKHGERYSVVLLKAWKEQHESRVRVATGIPANKRSHVVLYGSRIGDENSPLQMAAAFEAMFPDWYPADDRAIGLSMQSALDDSTLEYWAAESAHLRREFDRQIRVRVEEGRPNQFSVFAFAPQPLLILLGSLLTDKVPSIVYQLHREPQTWRWQSHPDNFGFILNEPTEKRGQPVLVFTLSDKVAPDRIRGVLNGDLAIWEVTCTDCHNDFLRSEAQLSQFRETVRRVIAKIRAAHPGAAHVDVFPVMPVSCAVELGRVRTSKVDVPWVVYDQNDKHGRFIQALTIGDNHE